VPFVTAEDKAETAAAKPAAKPDGRELFVREWIPGDKRSHGGDGLGPLFNESSCVGCHNQGGVGGAGPAGKNAQILTAFPSVPVSPMGRAVVQPPKSLPEEIFRGLFGTLDTPAAGQRVIVREASPPAAQRPVRAVAAPRGQPTVEELQAEGVEVHVVDVSPQQQAGPALSKERRADIEKQRKDLASVHPGLATSPSVVLHRSGTYAEYETWRQALGQGQMINVRGISPIEGDVRTFAAADKVEEVKTREALLRASTVGGGVQGMQLLQMTKQEIQATAQRRMFNQSTQVGNFALSRSERNTTALFGAGLIDSVTDDDLRALEAKQAKSGKVSGRVATLKESQIGRFGWKGQTAHLDEFVLTACAVEIGLNVPGHAQAGLPHKPDYKPAGLDLNETECRALVDFIRDLPAPKQRPLADEDDAAFVNQGSRLFAKIGCAECHVQDVGKAVGVYSDLLLHDMGPDLGDSGNSYGIFVPDSTPEGDVIQQNPALANNLSAPVGATRQEWRTAPLWGIRDSGPYLHDGRAETLDQAIALHGGESSQSAQMYFSLKPEERFQVITFLKSLVAPDAQPVASR
jgi:CxxC motif-containing protein (DUF1111 family)